MASIRELLYEIHRRSLWQTLSLYGVASWLVLQVVDTLAGALNLPEWAPSLALFLLIVGLPIVLATAFIQSAAAGAVVPGQVPTPRGVHTGLFTWRNAIGGGVLAFALWGVVSASWLLFGQEARGEDGTGGDAPPAIAVLPFENRSAAGEDAAFFADGLHDEILTLLSKINGLRVTSRTSVEEYRSINRNIRDIAGDLGVDHVVEGGVQRAGDRVRINIQLIDASTDEHRWAETYEETFTVANIFAIQADVARQITRALEAEISPAQQVAIEEPPTTDEEAYDFYLRGLAYERGRLSMADTRLNHQMMERALELDPNFVLASVQLAQSKIRLHFLGSDRSGELLTESRQILDEVVRDHPDLPEAHFAEAYYYYAGYKDYPRALEAYGRVRELAPGAFDIDFRVASVLRRQGRWEESLEHFNRSIEANPRSANHYHNAGVTLVAMRRFEEARDAFEVALGLLPDFATAARFYALTMIELEGLQGARTVMENPPASIATDPELVQLMVQVEQWDGDQRRALQHAELLPEELNLSQASIIPAGLLRSYSQRLLGDEQGAQAVLSRSARALEELLEVQPRDDRAMGALAVVYAEMGRYEEAIELALQGVENMPVTLDALIGPYRVAELATVYARAGRTDEAIDQLEYLLGIPGTLTRALLSRDPAWDPLRGTPRFAALLAG
ncbi:MAG: tetratricopeptide repeat protein [Longimicrobiales bacterium]